MAPDADSEASVCWSAAADEVLGPGDGSRGLPRATELGEVDKLVQVRLLDHQRWDRTHAIEEAPGQADRNITMARIQKTTWSLALGGGMG